MSIGLKLWFRMKIVMKIKLRFLQSGLIGNDEASAVKLAYNQACLKVYLKC